MDFAAASCSTVLPSDQAPDRGVDPAMVSPGPSLSPELRAQFLEALRTERRCSAPYVSDVARYLSGWAEKLGELDLSQLSVGRDVLPALEKATCRGARIAALKAFCSWLYRERFMIDRDPCAQLKVPQNRPEQWRRPKAVEAYRLGRVLSRLGPPWRDCVVLLLGTGWHLSELNRFVRTGSILEPQSPRQKGVAGILETVHKHGETFRTPVSARVRAAAERLRARGRISTAGLRRRILSACKAAGIVPWRPGQLRHTVATYAAQRAGLERTAAFLQHRDARTTRRFYVLHYTPQKVPTPC